MSDFLAEAQVLIKPNVTAFRAELAKGLAGLTVPVTLVPTGAGATATGFARLTEVQNSLKRSAQEAAGGQAVLDKSLKKSTASLLGAGTATAKLDSALLGLRTAVGGAAVIGLGALSLAAIAAGKALRSMIDITAQFEQELATFGAITGATADEIERVSERARELGADVSLPAVSASDAAVAMTELAKAGLDVEEAMAGAEGVLQLATAAQISQADAAQIAANALNSFGLAGDQAVRVADVLANAANAAQGSISDFAIGMRQVSAVARQVGLSLEDATALLSLFAKNGLSGSDAGTSLRVALIRLTAPTKKAADEIDRLGLKIRDAQGNFRPDVFAQFGEATESLGPAARDAAAALIFGQDAIRALSIGAREGSEGLRLMQFEIDQQGTAAELARARTEGLAGSFGNLQNQASTAGLSLGQQLSPALQEIVDVSAFVVSGINEIATSLGKLAKRIDELPGEGWGRRLFGEFSLIPVRVISKSEQEIEKLREEMQLLQDARIGAEAGGLSDLANQLTGDIERIRKQITALEGDSGKVGPAIAEPLRRARDALREYIDAQAKAGADVTKFVIALSKINIAISDYERAAKLGVLATNSVASGFELVDRNARSAASSINVLSTQVANLTRQSSALGDELLRIQSEGGTPAQQIAVLQEDIQTQRDLIAEAKAGPAEGRATAIRAARNKIIADQKEIDSLQAGLVADAKSAAASAKTAATEAQRARNEQFEALADLFGERQENISNQIERAGIAGNIEKQLRLNRALIASFKRERAALLERLRTLKVSNEVRKRILEAINDAIEEAQQTILRLQKQQQENIREFATPAIDLRIRIAEARDNIAAQIRLRRQRLALISKELAKLKNAGKKNTLEWLELKAQQAEEAAAIRDLQGQTKEKNNAFANLAFEFLQKQQGFAANLLGNLIPGFATAGLVGGQDQVQPPTPVDAIRAKAAGSRQTGPTFGQMATEVDILREMLRVLKAIQSGRAHPEAGLQRAQMSAVMDGAGGGGGGGGGQAVS